MLHITRCCKVPRNASAMRQIVLVLIVDLGHPKMFVWLTLPMVSGRSLLFTSWHLLLGCFSSGRLRKSGGATKTIFLPCSIRTIPHSCGHRIAQLICVVMACHLKIVLHCLSDYVTYCFFQTVLPIPKCPSLYWFCDLLKFLITVLFGFCESLLFVTCFPFLECLSVSLT